MCARLPWKNSVHLHCTHPPSFSTLSMNSKIPSDGCVIESQYLFVVCHEFLSANAFIRSSLLWVLCPRGWSSAGLSFLDRPELCKSILNRMHVCQALVKCLLTRLAGLLVLKPKWRTKTKSAQKSFFFPSLLQLPVKRKKKLIFS